MFSWLRKQPVGEDTTKLQLPPIQTSSTSTAEPDTAPRSFPTSPSEESSPYPNSLSGFLMEMLGVSSQNVDQLPETPEATSARDLSKAFDEYEELEVEDDYAKRKRERLERSAEPPASVTDVPTLFEATNEKLRSASSLSSSLSHRNSATQSVSNSREALTPLSPFETARKPVVLVGRNDNTDIVLTQDTAEKLRPDLPPLLREASTWILVYSMDQHGISLNTLYTRSEGQDAVLLAIKDGGGNVFGAFCSDALRIHSGYYGTGACFLWKETDDEQVKVFHATGKNDYLMLCEPHCIAFGGGEGHFGLWIDDELYNGHSGPCQTFDNERLSTTAEFEIVELEVWSFKI